MRVWNRVSEGLTSGVAGATLVPVVGGRRPVNPFISGRIRRSVPGGHGREPDVVSEVRHCPGRSVTFAAMSLRVAARCTPRRS